LLEESEIDPKLREITWSLLMLYDRAGEECSLLLAGAVVNIILWSKIKEETVVEECPYTWAEVEAMELYPLSCSYDKHVPEIHGKVDRGVAFFWKVGSKISNRHPALDKLDDLWYGKCVDRDDFHI